MKKILSFVIAVAAVTAFVGFTSCNSTTGQNAGTKVYVANDSIASSIVYIDMDRLSLEYDMANDLRATVETKVQNIQAEVNRRQKKLETDINSFQE
ncbi:MAG: OmpH family outer membrane protein, partial [Bacteroidales bacterium]|nr:OmpH family outer membrane protein [Bacteroidales bacterium]